MEEYLKNNLQVKMNIRIIPNSIYNLKLKLGKKNTIYSQAYYDLFDQYRFKNNFLGVYYFTKNRDSSHQEIMPF